jgi:hypothetical protein
MVGILIASLALVTAVSGTALAGKPSGSTGVKLAVPSAVFAGTTTATVTGGTGLWVHVSCYVSGALGMSSWERTDAAGHAIFALGPTASWTSGGASCTADAGSFNSRSKFVVAARTTFSVFAS